ncbi:MAG: 50S ribosomal protein L19e [Acidilobaceae archaeon]
MTDYSLQRRLAAEILGVGESRIWIDPDPEKAEEIAQALTRDDVARLIARGLIKVRPEKGNSRSRWLKRRKQRAKGRRRGHGKRKGEAGARSDPEKQWVARIRKIRRYLRWLRDNGVIDRKLYRSLYMKAKGGAFRSLSDLKNHLKTLGVAVR